MNNTEQSIEVSLSWLDTLSVFSGVASLIMGALAIWLSIVFYKMSSESEKRMETSANETKANLEKLEKIFDRMYTDTFGIMKDTVSDMRKITYRTESKFDVSTDIEKQVEDAVAQKLKGNEQLSKEEITALVSDLLISAKNETKKEEIRSLEEEIINFLRRKGEVSFIELKRKFELNFSEVDIFKVVHRLAKNGVINNMFFKDDDDELSILHTARVHLL